MCGGKCCRWDLYQYFSEGTEGVAGEWCEPGAVRWFVWSFTGVVPERGTEERMEINYAVGDPFLMPALRNLLHGS